jgi:hypothetical protein
MPKIDVNQTAEVIKRHDIEPAKLRAIIEELNFIAQPEVDEEKAPAVKKQFSILISDPDGKLPSGEFTGWVLQIPEDASVTSTCERIHKAAYEFNTTKKGRQMPAKTMGDALENVPAKHFKEQGIWVKTKAPVFMLTTNNEIPMERSDKASVRGKLSDA